MGKKPTHHKNIDSGESILLGSRQDIGSPEGFDMEVQGTARPSCKNIDSGESVLLGSRQDLGSPEGFKMEAQGASRSSNNEVK